MATTPFPEQEQQQPVIYPQAVPSGAGHSSGSVGPFIAVMSVLTVLTVLSCVLARVCAHCTVGLLDINYGGDCFRWMRRLRSCCISDDVEVVEVVVNAECTNLKSQGTEIPSLPSPS